MTAAPYPLEVTDAVLETVVVGLYLTMLPMDHIETAYYICQNKFRQFSRHLQREHFLPSAAWYGRIYQLSSTW
jgi:hypothetical protein